MKFLKNHIKIKTISLFHLNEKVVLFSIFCVSITVLFFNSSCNDNTKHQRIAKGEIEYKIDYLDDEKENPLIILLPRKMITTFNENSSNTLIEGVFGTFKITYILDNIRQNNSTLLQIMDKKYVYQAKTDSLAFGYRDMGEIKIEFTDKHKKIAGFDCKQAVATFPGEKSKSVEIYYTDEIELKNPNLNNPFHKISGVLMEFSVNLMGINMKFQAKKVTGKNINPNIFNIPKGFNRISLQEMEKIVNEFNLGSDK